MSNEVLLVQKCHESCSHASRRNDDKTWQWSMSRIMAMDTRTALKSRVWYAMCLMVLSRCPDIWGVAVQNQWVFDWRSLRGLQKNNNTPSKKVYPFYPNAWHFAQISPCVVWHAIQHSETARWASQSGLRSSTKHITRITTWSMKSPIAKFCAMRIGGMHCAHPYLHLETKFRWEKPRNRESISTEGLATSPRIPKGEA